MNTWGYLFLIAVLVLLASAMLYARFSGRSREKSLHHAPAELRSSTSAVDSGDFFGEALEADVSFAEETPVAEEAISETVKTERTPRLELAPVAAARTQNHEEERRERDYFDELQEAAAGLAKLMRSSSAERTEPVVYAPAEAEEMAAPVEIEEEVVADFIETTEIVETPAEVDIEVEQVPAVEVELRVLSPRELLGERVFAQFDEIDEGLEALEKLVGSIEANLRLLREGEFDSRKAPEHSEPTLEMPEAA